MSLLCAYQFEIQPPPGQTGPQCLAAVRDEVAGWVQGFYRRKGRPRLQLPFDGTAVNPRPGHAVCTEQRESAAHQLATLDWEVPDRRDPALAWRFSGVLACDARVVQAALAFHSVPHRFVLRAQRRRLGKGHPFASFGEVLAKLFHDLPCHIEGQPVATRPLLLGADQVEPFARQTLLNPDRVLPVVLFSPGAEDEALTEADALETLTVSQGQLLGLAHVASLRGRAAADRLAQALGPERSCPGEGVRLYWPGFSLAEHPGAHPFRSAGDLRKSLDGTDVTQDLYRALASLSAQVFEEGRLIRAARAALAAERAPARRAAASAAQRFTQAQAEAEAARRARERFRQERDDARRQVAALLAQLADAHARLAAPRDAHTDPPAPRGFEEFAAELERAWDENARLRADCELARGRAAELEAELRNCKDNLARLWQPPDAPADQPAEPAPAPGRPFASVADALRTAGADFADVLAVWEDATRSAEESPYASTAQVYRALQAIAEVGRAYFHAQDGGPPLGPVEQAFRSRVPFKYASTESPTTLSLFGADRVFHHRGQARQMLRHLTLGGRDRNNCLQIYFDFDDATRRVLIGHCGPHLPFYSQRT